MVKLVKSTLTCNCKDFQYACNYLHSVTVAERDGLLKEFLVKSN